jgi:hypothetical protein
MSTHAPGGADNSTAMASATIRNGGWARQTTPTTRMTAAYAVMAVESSDTIS